MGALVQRPAAWKRLALAARRRGAASGAKAADAGGERVGR